MTAEIEFFYTYRRTQRLLFAAVRSALADRNSAISRIVAQQANIYGVNYLYPTVMRHHPGRFQYWDVVNEVIDGIGMHHFVSLTEPIVVAKPAHQAAFYAITQTDKAASAAVSARRTR